MNKNIEVISPTRKVMVHTIDNGTPFSHSMTSHKNININAEVQPPLQLPGLIIKLRNTSAGRKGYQRDYVYKRPFFSA